MKATREPRMPPRGCSSISAIPACFSAASVASMSLDLVGDVVQSGTLLREEPAHRRLRAQRRQQLHVVLADVEQHGLHALLLDDLAVG